MNRFEDELGINPQPINCATAQIREEDRQAAWVAVDSPGTYFEDTDAQERLVSAIAQLRADAISEAKRDVWEQAIKVASSVRVESLYDQGQIRKALKKARDAALRSQQTKQ